MTTFELLSALKQHQVRVWVDGDKLRYSVIGGTLAPDLRGELVQHKRVLIQLLSQAGHTASGPPALQPVSRDIDLPLSFAQQRLWFLDRLAPGNAFYNIATAVRIQAALDLHALKRALDELVRRHESLRTRFVSRNGVPVQVVVPSISLALPILDLRPLLAGEREAEALRLATEEAQRPFDLVVAPLLRTTVLRLDDDEQVFLVTVHHIISDGWSVEVFWRELSELYSAITSGRPASLPALPVQYADFAVWQRGWLLGAILDSQLVYWRERLHALPALQLVIDRPRPQTQHYRGNQHPIALTRELSRAAKAMAEQLGATPFMLLLAAFKALLARYTRQDEIVVGSPIAGRRWAEIEPLIGFFVNSLVLRTDVSGDPSFRQLVARVRDVALGAFAHQDIPFEMLVEKLQPDRDPSRNPLFQVSFQLMAHVRPQAPTAIAPRNLDVQRGTAIFDLAMSLADAPGGLSGCIEYNTDLFEPGTIAGFADHYTVLVAAACAEPDAPISLLPLISEDQRRRIAVEWNDTGADLAAECLHHRFARQAARTPTAEAVAAPGHRVSYQELDELARRVAAALYRAGVRRSQVVAVHAERSVELVAAILGVLKVGAAYLPLDPSYPSDRRAMMLEDSAAVVVLCDHHDLATSTRVVRIDDALASPGELRLAPGEEATPSDPAYIIYTSGSTGRPKGVVIEHRAIVNHMAWMDARFPLTASDRVLQRAPIGFDASVWEFHAPLAAGAVLVMAPPARYIDPVQLAQVVATERITVLQLVPSLLRLLLDEPLFRNWNGLRRLYCGGEAVDGELAQRFLASSTAELINLYGPTEATIDATYHVVARGATRLRVPIGRPIANMRAFVVDRAGAVVPPGIPGELYLAGTGLARGYLGDPDLTRERFTIDASGERVYRTGDLCRYLPDGEIEFLGRVDHQIKLRGIRVEPAEVEAVLRSHPAIDTAAVVVREDRPGDKRLVAYVVPDHLAWQGASAQSTREQVAEWQRVYDEVIYRDPPGSGVSDPTFDISGWNSSYTGQPIPECEMRDWLDHIVSRILRSRPRRVLEIGCGTGLILFRVAPTCERYVACDFSAPVLHTLRSRLVAVATCHHVETLHRTADDLSELAPGSFDTIVINSVVQYFPNIEYLVQVLDGAARLLAPGGSIFVGDIRSLALLEAFHASVELHRAHGAMPVSMLRQLVRKRVSEEQELVIAPEFFDAVAHRMGATATRIELKRGTADNELTRFRYDVTFEFASDAGAPAAAPPRFEIRDVEAVTRQLADEAPPALQISRIANARVAADLLALALMTRDDDSIATVAELRVSVAKAAEPAVDPEALWRAAAGLPYDLEVGWCRAGSPGDIAAVFWRHGVARPAEAAPSDVHPWRHYTNNPLHGLLTRKLLPDIRCHVERQLPEHIVPSSFVLLSQLPMLANGKLDRAALPAPELLRATTEHRYVRPRSELEQQLAAIWEQVLHIERVSSDDHFFMIGGHSLLAVQVISRIRGELDVEVPLGALFDAPTLHAFTQSVEQARSLELPAGAPAIKRVPRVEERADR